MGYAMVLAALVAFVGQWDNTWYPAGKAPETEEERRERHAVIATVVDRVAWDNETQLRPTDAAALITAVWAYESRFEHHVHAGLVSPIGHQDHGRARCLGQIHTWPGNPHLPTEADHQALAGLDEAATERCARVTLAYFWAHAQRCLRRKTWSSPNRWEKPLQDWEAATLFASYGSGRCTTPLRRHGNRAKTFRALAQSLREAQE